ncbi:16S rRNA (cytidine(1402)-2'-O)-methyltransferase [Candidatus Curtissbacteria bacterium]|nr:16S rRNA (cytidine(1402)-2'-O)-methyltransferase [Candidatus Curtissbacteria bacterium]
MGTLYIVSTPIGNLKDITLRAIETLGQVNYVLCEDTRITDRLLKHYNISKRMVSFGEFSEEYKSKKVLKDLKEGDDIALVSDAGTPLISDPGFKLVREATKNNVRIESIPGPSAAIAALVISGLPPDKFLFLGYLSKKESKRREILKRLSEISKLMSLTIVLYESPHRLIKTVNDLKEIFGDIEIVICRELTKFHEEVRREKISGSIAHFSKITPKGEFTLLFHSPENSEKPRN